ncbi:SET domain-containing protein [Apiospora kogelbergensis]|uniref:SET domain-containing protein n=1 Tax=Apiospora kogelbergensis TaxID=1337665 RepID=UPI00312E7EFA
MEDEERVQDGIENLKVEAGEQELGLGAASLVKQEKDSALPSPDRSKGSRSRTRSRSPSMSPDEQKPRSESASTPDGAAPPKLMRKASSKVVPRKAPVFTEWPDMTEASKEHFQVIPDCLYGSKSLGSTDHDALDCDCDQEWRDGTNHACGEDSDCINRATKMECVDQDCNCGDGCQNQRFQRKQYADVSVIKTEKKGFGLRANKDLQANDFIFEYIGEVINEPTFRRRMVQYDKEGIKHFYFMSLSKHEFVDATKKGNLGRFCNHSCNPNCYVDKWVVGNKLRMGIFASCKVQAGEELVFNYNVDRYGADPQPCYCAEPNCIGFIGGKTQTERATKLSDATIEALGIDDGDSWETAVAVVKKPRKKRAGEDDEEYVNSIPARGLDEKGVQKVMASLMQCKEKWIAVKLLERIQACDERLLPCVQRMHGYEFLKTTLNTFREDHNVVLQILDILDKFPRLTRNKITDSKIEQAIQPLTDSEHEDVARESKRLLEDWSSLETGYRIPRKARNAQGTPNNAQAANSFGERRSARAEEPISAKPAAVVPLPDNVPKGPRSTVPQRNTSFQTQRHRRPPDQATLPAGWFIATDKTGSWYFYTKSGQTTWHKPTAPAPEIAAQQGSFKAIKEQKTLQDIIDSLTKPDSTAALRRSASQTPQHVTTPAQEPKKDKWRSLPMDKQMKIYENTLFPHVKYVMDKFRHKLPKDDLKKFGKEINKKLVSSDYKNKRVDDPTTITDKQEKKIKKYVKEYFDKAVQKYTAHERKKVDRTVQSGDATSMDLGSSFDTSAQDAEVILTDDEDAAPTPASSERKRKREDDAGSATATPVDFAERERLREQEAALERENELNMLDFEQEQQGKDGVHGSIGIDDGSSNLREGRDTERADEARKQEVMSH